MRGNTETVQIDLFSILLEPPAVNLQYRREELVTLLSELLQEVAEGPVVGLDEEEIDE